MRKFVFILLFFASSYAFAQITHPPIMAATSRPTCDSSREGGLISLTGQSNQLDCDATGGGQSTSTCKCERIGASTYEWKALLAIPIETGVYYNPGLLSTDGTQCSNPAEVTLNSGPKQFTISCAKNSAAVIYGNMRMPGAESTDTLAWDGGTVTFQLDVFHTTTETITWAGDISAQCRATGEQPSGTWGTAVQADVSITTANNIASATTAAVTPTGTCAAGDVLWWRWVIDEPNFSTNAANADLIGVTKRFSLTAK